MNRDAFETTAGRLYKVDELTKQVKACRTLGQGTWFESQCPYSPEGNRAQRPVLFVAGECGAPPFKHPLIVKESAGDDYVAADLRGYVRQDRDGGVKPSSRSEYTFHLGRAFLTSVGISPNAMTLLNFSDVPAQVFSRWLTDRINSQLHLELEDQIVVRACAAWFYVCQFYDKDSFDRGEKDREVARCLRITGMDKRHWDTVMGRDELPWAGTLDLFCELVKRASGEAVRVDGLDRRFVTEVAVGSWRGAQGREFVAVGLEHPATWIAIIHLCVAESSYYKRMPLGESVERLLKRRNDKDVFLTSVARLPF